MSVSENIRLMKRWYEEVWQEKKDETIRELLAADAEVHGHVPASLRGPEQFAQFAHQIRGAFPDLKVAVEDIFGDGDKVAARWVASGTHRGEGFGPPSQKTIKVHGTSIVQFKDGKIVAGWDSWDRLGMLEQIGAIPSSQSLSAA
jgi:steroid delta-isomerase-like uncharacterized protein